MRFLTKSALFAAALMPVLSMAQRATDFDRSFQGDGVLKVNGRVRYRPDVATVDVNQNGTWAIRLQGVPDGTLSGRWRRGRGNDIFLSIGRAFNDGRATGSGTLVSGQQGRVSQIELRGKANGDSFDLDMHTSYGNGRNDDRGNNGRVSSIDTRERGEGSFQWRNRFNRVREATVQLRRNGDARIALQGDDTYAFEGRWRTDNRGRVIVDIGSGLGSAGTEGRAQVNLRGNSFDSVTVSGTSRGSKFEGAFKTR